MSLYLRISVGRGVFLLNVAPILEIRSGAPTGGEAASWQGENIPSVDLRELFGEPDRRRSSSLVVRQNDGRIAALVADRVHDLAELRDDAFGRLPPIGVLGGLIDAVLVAPDQERPALRLRGEDVLGAAAASGGAAVAG